MKRLLRKILWLLPIPLFIIAGNWALDPLHTFRADSYLDSYLEAYLDEKPISCLQSNQRLFQKKYISLQQQPKDIALLGTSRSRQVHAELFPGKTFYNHHVDGSSFADMLALLELMETNGQLPETLIIEMELGLWQRAISADIVSPVLMPAFSRILEKIGEPPVKTSLRQEWSTFTRKWKPLFSFANLKYGIRNKQQKPAVGDFPQVCYVKYPDGSVSDYNGIRRTEAEVFTFARQYADFRIERPLLIKDTHTRLFEKMITYLEEKEVRVVLYMPPLHPEAYRLISEDGDQITKVESLLLDFCKARNIPSFGGYDPKPFQLENHHYYDATHMSREGVTQVYAGYQGLFSGQ